MNTQKMRFVVIILMTIWVLLMLLFIFIGATQSVLGGLVAFIYGLTLSLILQA